VTRVSRKSGASSAAKRLGAVKSAIHKHQPRGTLDGRTARQWPALLRRRAEDQHAQIAEIHSNSDRIARTSPGPSVLKPISFSPSTTTVLTPPPAALVDRHHPSTASPPLYGNGQFVPIKSRCGNSFSASRKPSGEICSRPVGRIDAGGAQRGIVHLRPEREWATGSPITERRIGGFSEPVTVAQSRISGKGVDLLHFPQTCRLLCRGMKEKWRGLKIRGVVVSLRRQE